MRFGPAVLVASCSLALAACGEEEGTGEVVLRGRGFVIPWWLLLLAAIVITYGVIRSRRR